MSDPKMKDYIHQVQLGLIKERYGALFKELKLTPEQTEKFTEVIGDLWLRGTDLASKMTPGSPDQAESTRAMSVANQEMEAQLQALLGPAGYARYQEFNQETPARTTIKLLDDHVGADPLNADQKARLFQLVKAEPYRSTHGIAGEVDEAFFGSPEDVDRHFQQVEESHQRILEKAAEFLNPQQLSALGLLQSNSITAAKIQGEALMKKH
jgi:hypothetical protein